MVPKLYYSIPSPPSSTTCLVLLSVSALLRLKSGTCEKLKVDCFRKSKSSASAKVRKISLQKIAVMDPLATASEVFAEYESRTTP